MIEVRQNVLKQNDIVARALRQRFHDAGVFVVSLVSSPGAGKTALLEKTLTLLRQQFRVAALVGDLATENDAARLARSQAPVKQIITGTVCHLEAAMVQNALEGWKLDELDFLFIENVGNLVCPSSYDLGEDLRLVLMSVTEGEDKPLKYPTIFNSADVAVITKIDLAAAVEFNADCCESQHSGGAAWDDQFSTYRQSPAQAWKSFSISCDRAARSLASWRRLKVPALRGARLKSESREQDKRTAQK